MEKRPKIEMAKIIELKPKKKKAPVRKHARRGLSIIDKFNEINKIIDHDIDNKISSSNNKIDALYKREIQQL